MDYIVCPLRTRQFDIKDFWTEADRCTYCGSISSKYFFKLISEGHPVKLNKEDKSFNFSGDLSHLVFHHAHLCEEEREYISKLYNEKKIKVII